MKLDPIDYNPRGGSVSRAYSVKLDDYEEDDTRLTPEKALLWGLLERAINDLSLKGAENLENLRSAVAWFHGNRYVCFTFHDVKELLELSGHLLDLIGIRVLEAEKYAKAKRAEIRNKSKIQRKAYRTRGCPPFEKPWNQFRAPDPAIRRYGRYIRCDSGEGITVISYRGEGNQREEHSAVQNEGLAGAGEAGLPKGKTLGNNAQS